MNNGCDIGDGDRTKEGADQRHGVWRFEGEYALGQPHQSIGQGMRESEPQIVTEFTGKDADNPVSGILPLNGAGGSEGIKAEGDQESSQPDQSGGDARLGGNSGMVAFRISY